MNVHLLRIATCLAGAALVATACATTPGAPAVSEPADDGAVAVTVPTEQTAPVAPTASDDRSAAAVVPGTLYGTGVSLTESIPVSELVENVDDYVGQTVRVEGLVTGVCAKRGCWIELASDREFETMRVKVEDGVIVFPVSARGQYVVAEGVVTRTDYDLEGARKYMEHRAEESGESFDPASVTGPMTLVGLAGTGAVIRGGR